MRLIDADAVLKDIEDLKKLPWYKRGETSPYHAEYLERKEAVDIIRVCIKETPTVDAEPVVRCMDCCWRGMDNCPMEFFWDNHPSDDKAFCSFGKARIDGGTDDEDQT